MNWLEEIATRQWEMTTEVLSFVRMKNEAEVSVPREFDLNFLIENAISASVAKITSKDLHVEYSIPNFLAPNYFGNDSTHFRRKPKGQPTNFIARQQRGQVHRKGQCSYYMRGGGPESNADCHC